MKHKLLTDFINKYNIHYIRLSGIEKNQDKLESLYKLYDVKRKINNFDNKCLFIGINNLKDLHYIKMYNGIRYIIFGGTNYNSCLGLTNYILEKLKYMSKKEHNKFVFISISDDIEIYLNKHNINNIRVDINLNIHSLFKNNIDYGKKIYISYDKNVINIDKLISTFPNIEFIYDKSTEIYNDCFIGLCLKNNIDTINGFKLINKPVVCNKYALKWKNMDDIINYIKLYKPLTINKTLLEKDIIKNNINLNINKFLKTLVNHNKILILSKKYSNDKSFCKKIVDKISKKYEIFSIYWEDNDNKNINIKMSKNCIIVNFCVLKSVLQKISKIFIPDVIIIDNDISFNINQIFNCRIIHLISNINNLHNCDKNIILRNISHGEIYCNNLHTSNIFKRKYNINNGIFYFEYIDFYKPIISNSHYNNKLIVDINETKMDTINEIKMDTINETKMDNIDKIEICNNMCISKIKNNLTWIHGKNKNDILITIFVISISDKQLKYCIESINKLDLNHSVLINVIQNIYPTNKAYNIMRERCTTDYFIQLDEDMELYQNAINIIYKTMKKSRYLNIYRLRDDYLGLEDDSYIYGLKVYNQNIMKKYPTMNNGTTITSAVDRCWHKQISKDGYKKRTHTIIVGNHERNRTNFDIFLKYSKVTNNLLTKYINKVTKCDGDLARLLIPVYKGSININEFMNNVLTHLFVYLNENIDNINNNIICLNSLFKNNKINKHILKLYSYPDNYLIYNLDIFKFNIKVFLRLFTQFNIKNNINLHSLLGIANKLCNNYYYSFDKYPYKLHNYFNNFIGKMKLCIISNELPNIGGSSTNAYSMTQYFSKIFDIKCIFIDRRGDLNNKKLIKNKNEYLKIFPENILIIEKKNDDDINNEIIKFIKYCDIILFRNPQNDLSYIDFKALKLISKKIISIFGGGYRNIFSRTMEKIKADRIKDKKNLLFSDYVKKYNDDNLQISNNEIISMNKKYQNVLNNSDYICTNSTHYDKIFKNIFKSKYLGNYYLSSITKFTKNICKHNITNKWYDRKYDILLVCSSLSRTVKGVNIFIEIIKNTNYNILLIGNSCKIELPNNITYLPFQQNIKPYLLNSKILMNVSLFEASPNTLFEGISMGCNILTSKIIDPYIFKQECIVENYINIDEWKNKIKYLLKNPIDSLTDRNILTNSIVNFEDDIFKLQISKKDKLVLIISFLEEYIDSQRVHYSKAKCYLLADSLINMGYNVFFLTNKINNVKYKDKYYYINYKLLTPDILSKFKYIFCGLHNKEYVEPLGKLNIYNDLLLAKKISNVKIICKTCIYPTHIDKFCDSYLLFDKIILQTSDIKLPQYITKKITKTFDKYSVSDIIKLYKNTKFYYSEMTFSINKCLNKSKSIKYNIDPKITNILYMGRLTAENGMNTIYLIKLMKLLGPKFKLWIIPGSFKLPYEYPTIKHSPKNDIEKFNMIKTFFMDYKIKYDERNLPKYYYEKKFIDRDETNICNIEVLPPIKYGDHFDLIKQFDIGIGFAENRKYKVDHGSAKLFDYMYSKLKIVFEDGWQNTKYINQYNFGITIPLNSSIIEFKNGILKVNDMDKNKILYNNFIKEHNGDKRLIDLLKSTL